jgi:bifunctional UDP-N-acetylglucosamine pyrophosphorylase/glucosamine-1-phosphate N-acetyltransferase
VTIGAGSVIAAGTTVTQDVPADALAIARVTQVNRVDWAAKRRALLAGRSVAKEEPANKVKSAKASVQSKKKRR